MKRTKFYGALALIGFLVLGGCKKAQELTSGKDNESATANGAGDPPTQGGPSDPGTLPNPPVKVLEISGIAFLAPSTPMAPTYLAAGASVVLSPLAVTLQDEKCHFAPMETKADSNGRFSFNVSSDCRDQLANVRGELLKADGFYSGQTDITMGDAEVHLVLEKQPVTGTTNH